MIRFRNVAFSLVATLTLAAACSGADGSMLKTPPGAKVAVEVFEDLECPDCARWYPVLFEVANAHKVPVVLHDFPLPMHPWSLDAAVYARFFDTKSQKLGEDFRGYIYKNQPSINKGNLQQWIQKFADENKSPLPFAVDPEGKLKALIMADRDLGSRAGLQHTPTIFVVGHGGPPSPYTEIQEVQDMEQNKAMLGQAIDDMEKKVGPVAAPKTTKTRTHKKKAS